MSSVAEPPSRAAASRAFTIDRQGDLATVWFDLPGEKVNKFSSSVLRELSAIERLGAVARNQVQAASEAR